MKVNHVDDTPEPKPKPKMDPNWVAEYPHEAAALIDELTEMVEYYQNCARGFQQ